MEWNITNGRPVYVQLVEQLELALVNGTFPPGSKVPPVRELAADAGVNPNTMQRALAELERCGLVYSQRNAGRFVTEDRTMIENAKRELARRHIRTFVENMGRLGYREEEIVSLLRQETNEEGEQHVGSGM